MDENEILNEQEEEKTPELFNPISEQEQLSTIDKIADNVGKYLAMFILTSGGAAALAWSLSIFVPFKWITITKCWVGILGTTLIKNTLSKQWF